MSSGDAAQRLRDLLAKLESSVKPSRATPGDAPAGMEPGTHLLLYSFMLWESDPAAAAGSLSRLYAEIIDPNELRVALPDEICAWCGAHDEIARERAARVRACLNDIYRREHGVSLARLATISKREVRDYLDSLEGVPAFVAARVSLLGFGSHAAPLDARLCRMLRGAGAMDGAGDLAESERWLERQVRASESERIALLLEGWREHEPKPRARPAAAPAGKRAGAPKPKQDAPRPAPRAQPRSKSAKPGTPKRPKKDV
ncbi:MAG TPA: hypothetical protein VFF69_01990 [Phycisphaerales bacterium]|nr:hypothetical protein [Phycisphaerales bacterium]